jgi:hypothetical protein
MAVAMGGRIAEELIFGEDDITTGAGGDFQQATRTARLMVEQMGFSSKLGQIAWGGGGPSFLGAQAGQASDFSQKTRDDIDSEVRRESVVAFVVSQLLSAQTVRDETEASLAHSCWKHSGPSPTIAWFRSWDDFLSAVQGK